MSEAAFLGCGYRVAVPVPEAADFARTQAQEVLDRLGIDRAPWPALPGGPVEVAGGAAYDAARRSFGPVTVRVGPLRARPPTTLVAVDLPWTWPSDGPLAGLPTISGLASAVAERSLAPGTAGLWWNHRDELCTSTTGPLLLRLGDRWVRPDDAAGAVPSWASVRASEERSARPVVVTREMLARADEVVAVPPLVSGGVRPRDVVGILRSST